ncbi:MAG: methylated-DNA--[protein]-cysteine S-methyltransferase [Gallibacter sp.]|nr:methylated-DNA--[protein]-cysteine S-methyltransferase [Gallibacter sp.]
MPYGETRTHKEIAVAIGNPKASRAVGMANNKNPITIVVPCHRVVGSNGKMVGYAGGLDMKRNCWIWKRETGEFKISKVVVLFEVKPTKDGVKRYLDLAGILKSI